MVALKSDNLCSKYRLAGGATVSQKCFMHSSTETNLQLIQTAVCERINARILGHVAVISKRMILEAENLAALLQLAHQVDQNNVLGTAKGDSDVIGRIALEC